MGAQVSYMTYDEVQAQKALLLRVHAGTYDVATAADLEAVWGHIVYERISVSSNRGQIILRLTKLGKQAAGIE